MSETNEFINKLMNKNNDELDAILSFADGIKTETRVSENAPTKDREFTRKIITADFPADAVPKNMHHVFLEHECEYLSFSSICEETNETAAPIIKDAAEKVRSNFETREIKLPAPDEVSGEQTEKIKQTDPPPSCKTEAAAAEDPDDTLYDDISDAEKFISMQGVKHPKIFFVIGLSIFSLAILGLISCAYLGLNAMKKFTQNYQSTQTTSVYYTSDRT